LCRGRSQARRRKGAWGGGRRGIFYKEHFERCLLRRWFIEEERGVAFTTET
jgi:hypothetical protein